MARNGGFGELDSRYAHLRTIRVKSDPAVDDRVDGAPDGKTPLLYSPHPRQMPEPSASSGGLVGLPLEGIPWNARGRIGQENLRQPDCCRGRSGKGRLVLVSVFLPWLFKSRQREALYGLAFES